MMDKETINDIIIQETSSNSPKIDDESEEISLSSPIKGYIPIYENNKQIVKDAYLQMMKENDEDEEKQDDENNASPDSNGSLKESPNKQFTQKTSFYQIENYYSIPVKQRSYLKKEYICVSEQKALLKQNIPTRCMPQIKIRGRTLCIHPNLEDADHDTSQLESDINKQVQPRNAKFMQREEFQQDYLQTLDVEKPIDSSQETESSPRQINAEQDCVQNILKSAFNEDLAKGTHNGPIHMKYNDRDLGSILKKSYTKTPPQSKLSKKIIDPNILNDKSKNDFSPLKKKINGENKGNYTQIDPFGSPSKK